MGDNIIRLTEAEIYNAIESTVFQILKEDITKSEVNSLIASKLESNLESKEFKKKVKEITADIVTNLFKTLWQQNNIWKKVCQQ